MKVYSLVILSIIFFGSAKAANSPYIVESYDTRCEALSDVTNYDTEFLRKHWKIIVGEDQWLANTSMDFPTYDHVASTYAISEIERLTKVLESFGTRLMLVYLPARGLVHEKQLNAEAAEYDVVKASKTYLQTLETLRQHNVLVPELSKLLESSDANAIFYKKDIHWSIDGARATAKLVADMLDDIGLADKNAPAKYETLYNGVVQDVANVEEAIAQLCDASFAPTYSPTYVTTEISSDDINDSFSLFDEVTDDIVLLGTSFSALSKFNFSGFLQQYANVPVANYALSGGGLIGSWINYLKSGDFHESPPKLIIWEVPGWRDFEPRFFHGFMPLFYDSCNAGSALISSNGVNIKTKGIANALFDAKGSSFPAKNLMVDLQFNSPHVESVKLRVWFENGANRTYNLRHQYRTPNDGRFLTLLGNDHNYPDENVMGVDVDSIQYYESAGERPSATFDMRICKNPIPYD